MIQSTRIPTDSRRGGRERGLVFPGTAPTFMRRDAGGGVAATARFPAEHGPGQPPAVSLQPHVTPSATGQAELGLIS